MKNFLHQICELSRALVLSDIRTSKDDVHASEVECGNLPESVLAKVVLL